ncbi:hypothetical protein NP493_521g00015 [Ridgeia piscesae]|uniref:Uncharacterized protein n=1 Tax=Ridgeia piscesae TaxID=27915 RepID=A0AAD9NQS4_RIDPI|nr:hypothetical protein NP493_521g00015 [Ridgeia piscesae]
MHSTQDPLGENNRLLLKLKVTTASHKTTAHQLIRRVNAHSEFLGYSFTTYPPGGTICSPPIHQGASIIINCAIVDSTDAFHKHQKVQLFIVIPVSQVTLACVSTTGIYVDITKIFYTWKYQSNNSFCLD